LVKIGKTTRDPESRAEELSQATGVAIPFYVAFSIEVADCHSAEDYVYAMLECKGIKRTPNREFFQMPLQKAIEVLVLAEQHLKEQQTPSSDVERETGLEEYEWDLPSERHGMHPGRAVFEQAIDAFYGHGDTIRDQKEALRLLYQSKALNFPAAFTAIAEYFVQWTDPEDYDQAFSILKEGAQRGHGRCFVAMAELFDRRSEPENAAKCWKKYFQSETFFNDDDKKWTGPTEDDFEIFELWAGDSGNSRAFRSGLYLLWLLYKKIPPDSDVQRILMLHSNEIISDLRSTIEYQTKQLADESFSEECRKSTKESLARNQQLLTFAEEYLRSGSSAGAVEHS
jgi:hypothetical protein